MHHCYTLLADVRRSSPLSIAFWTSGISSWACCRRLRSTSGSLQERQALSVGVRDYLLRRLQLWRACDERMALTAIVDYHSHRRGPGVEAEEREYQSVVCGCARSTVACLRFQLEIHKTKTNDQYPESTECKATITLNRATLASRVGVMPSFCG